MRLRLLFAVAFASFTLAAIVVACSDQTNSSTTSTGDASADRRVAEPDDAGDANEPEEDLDGGATDAKPDAKPVRAANGPGEAGDDCVFNHDCQLALRCECDQGVCTCEPGVRGTGKNGIDTCDAGEDCTSSLCVEGPGDSGVHYCSDECASNVDCTGKLPKCEDIAFIGKICIR